MNEAEPKTFLCDRRQRGWFWDYNDVFESDLSANAMLVRLYLARCANGDRQAWPSLNTIARNCRISKPTVIKALKQLEEKGWLEKVIRKRPNQEYETTIYVLKDPPVTGTAGSGLEEGGGKAGLPPVKNKTGEGGGVVNDVYHLVNQFDNLVKQVDSNNTQIKRNIVVVDKPGTDVNNSQETGSGDHEFGECPKGEENPGDEQPAPEDRDVSRLRALTREATGAEVEAEFFQQLLKYYPADQIKQKIKLIGNMAENTGIRNVPGLIVAALRGDFEHIPGRPQLISEIMRQGGSIRKKRAGPGPASKTHDNEDLKQRKRELLKSLYLS